MIPDFCCVEIDFAGRGWVPVSPGTVEQRSAELFFKLEKLLVEGRPEHVLQNWAVKDVILTDEEYAALDRAFPAPEHKTYLDIVQNKL